MSDLVTNNQEVPIEAYKPAVDAASIYEAVGSADDLFATEEEKQQLAAQGDLDQTAYVQEDNAYDISWRYHRQLSFKEEERLNWRMPLSKEQVEEGFREYELNPNDPNQNIVAVRGVPIEFGWTNTWSKPKPSAPAGKTYVYCTSDELVEKLPGKNRVTKDKYPVKAPYPRMHFSKAKQNELHQFWTKNSHFDLYATRVTYRQEGDELAREVERRSCLDCVKNCEHFEGDDISVDNAPRCRPTGRLLFVVFEVGIKNVTEHNQDIINNPIKIDWKPIAEAGILGYDNKPLTKPFVINLLGLGSSVMKSIGKGPYDLPVYLPGDIPPNRPKDCILPDNNVKSMQDYFDWLHDSKASDGRCVPQKGTGKNLYPVMTEIYIAKMTETQANKKVTPVFRTVAVGPRAEFNGVSLKDYVFNAKLVLNSEAATAEGNNAGDSVLTLPTLSTTPNNGQALPAAVVETPATKPVTAEAKAEPANNLTKAAISAFTPPTFG